MIHENPVTLGISWNRDTVADHLAGVLNFRSGQVFFFSHIIPHQFPGKRLGKETPAFLEFMTAPASKILDKWFESEPLKATLATDATIGAMTSPYNAESGYVPQQQKTEGLGEFSQKG